MNQWGRGFHIEQGDVDPGDRGFRPRLVGIVEMHNTIKFAEKTIYQLY